MVPQLHRHQASLESVIDPLATPSLSSHDRAQAYSIFDHIVQYCESYELANSIAPPRRYRRGRLLQLMYQHVLSDHGRDAILIYFLSAITAIPEENSPHHEDFSHVLSSLSNFQDRSTLEKDGIVRRVQKLADHVVDGFFLPIRGSSAATPQPTPHLTPQPRQGDDVIVGTTERLSSLRGHCLVRDRHRCVISQRFDEAEAVRRFNTYHAAAVDDDKQLLIGQKLGHLEVAHIIPHSLSTSVGEQTMLPEAKVYTLRILDMFDPGVRYLVEGVNIDRTYNALTLSLDFHRRFGSLQLYFEATPGLEHTYTVKSTLQYVEYEPQLPTTRTFFITPEHTIDPPMARLLAIHRACCLILHMSGAGVYIDKVLRDREELTAMSDGSTEIGSLVSLGLHKLTMAY